jgi:hypothetical protein
MRKNRGVVLVVFSCLLIVLGSCSHIEPPQSSNTPEGAEPASVDELTPGLNAQEVAGLGSACERLFQQHIDAWDSRDPESLRGIYTEDIVHFDGKPLFTGIDQVVEMAEFMYDIFPYWEMEAGETFISRDKCLGTWVNWGLFDFLKDNPGREYDVLETREDMIYYWRMYYDQAFHSAFVAMDLVDDEFLSQYALAWSSGSSSDVVKLYAADARLLDSLFDFSISSQSEIPDYYDRLRAKSPLAAWEVRYTFAESKPYGKDYPLPSQGAIFGITVDDLSGNPCEIRAAVILTPNDKGLIQSEEIFYNAESLITCGWVN